MSIIILTPPPKKPGTSTAPGTLSSDATGLASRLSSDFLHLIGLEGHRFDTFEQLRDFAQAQIDATRPTVPPAIDPVAAPAAPVTADPAAPQS